MTPDWTEQLSAYLDGDLSAAEVDAIEARLSGSPEARELLAQLRAIKERAAALTPTAPTVDLWAGIARRIAEDESRATRVIPFAPAGRWSISLPQALAASIALMLLAGGAAWVLRGRIGRPPVVMAAAGTTTPVVTTVAAGADLKYDAAVADLERVLREGRGRLDTTTVRILERNLAVIDSAIVDAQRALASDPASTYLNTYLSRTRLRKLELLRQAAGLVTQS